MLVVEKVHHIKMFVENLPGGDPKILRKMLKESFPNAKIYEEIPDKEYTDEMAVAEAKAAYSSMHPAKMLTALRKEASLTQEQLANETGTSKTSISAMENGTRPISDNMAQRLAKVLMTHPKVLKKSNYPRYAEL